MHAPRQREVTLDLGLAHSVSTLSQTGPRSIENLVVTCCTVTANTVRPSTVLAAIQQSLEKEPQGSPAARVQAEFPCSDRLRASVGQVAEQETKGEAGARSGDLDWKPCCFYDGNIDFG